MNTLLKYTLAAAFGLTLAACGNQGADNAAASGAGAGAAAASELPLPPASRRRRRL